MKNVAVNVRLLVLIPVVFAGLALLAAVGSYQIAVHTPGRDAHLAAKLLLWCLLVSALAFVVGFVIMRPLLRPVDKLVSRTQQMAAVRDLVPSPVEPLPQHDEIARFSAVVNQVTELLGQVEAERLFPGIVGHSRCLLSVLSLTYRIAGSDASVLIVGESGTGKELVARGLHEHSRRRRRPFLAVNCAAIHANLLESELFGHEKGAFTGADARKIGTFEAADGGTLFLDEIGDMPLPTQAKILRVLEQKEIQRVGGTSPIPVDVRIVAATNKDLPAMVAKDTFREDLLFRVNVFNLALPALRERREDIPLLAAHFLRTFGKTLTISPEALARLTSYPWPGNVRELRNAMEAASVLADAAVLPAHLPAVVAQSVPTGPPPLETAGNSGLKLRLEEIERAMIIEALSRSGGVQARAAELLGVTQRSLWHRVAKLQIDVAATRPDPR